MNIPPILTGLILSLFGGGFYMITGLLIGATIYKRHNASWKAWRSNLGEFVMGFKGTINIFIYMIAWPIVIAYSLPSKIKLQKRINKATKRSTPPPKFDQELDKDFDITLLYPTVVFKVSDEKKD